MCIEYHVYHLISQHLLTSKKKEERSNRRRQNAKIKITLCDSESGSKVTLDGARELVPLITITHMFVCFRVTSPVDIVCARSSLCLACYCGRKCSATHRVLKSHRYFNINILNTLICVTSILMDL